ncbi:MAG: glycosyltransferase, partial [Novosphingobium sp.]
MPSRFTVLVPAHNEERTIGRLLAGLAPPPGREAEFEVIVLCNDCTDATAARAIEAMPQARVVQIPEPGKANAINRGLDLAHAGPVLVVDADIRVDFAALAAVAECLRDGRTMIAAPALAVDWSRASRWVRAYYRVWLTQPYVTEDLTGSGVFGLSREGIARLGRLPAIIADDAYARSRFAQAERLSVSLCAEGRDTSFTVTAPADLRSLLRIEARRRAGD